MALSLCPSCNRHVKGDACPFCGARSEPTNEGSSAPRALRAIVVFGGAAIATSACGLANGYGGPPPEMQNAPTTTSDAGTD